MYLIFAYKLFIMRILLLFIVLSAVACVPTKKYDALMLKKNQLEAEKNRLAKFEPLFNECMDDKARLEGELADVNERLAFYEENMKGLESSTQELAAKYEQSLRENRNITSQFTKERDSLQRELAMVNSALDRCAKEVREWELRFEKQLMWSNKYKSDLNEKDSLIENLQFRLQKQHDEMEALKGNIELALARFNNDELSIRQEGGRIYISLSQKLLFAKGSDKIDRPGKEAIRDAAQRR